MPALQDARAGYGGKLQARHQVYPKDQPSEAVLEQLGVSLADIGGKQFYTGQGCNSCNDTGYSGRQGLFELLDMTDPLRELITERAATVVLRQKALELGMNSLRDDGLRNIYSGITTIEEVLKYT